jgi:hypothetical protein
VPKICYIDKKFGAARLSEIERAIAILDEYAAQGYDLTLRQLYYQHVARGFIPNKDSEYKRLGEMVNDARLAGLIDWNHITDRTRELRELAHWDDPASIVEACAKQFRLEKWASQENYVEVWVEKDALVGILQVACEPLDVAYFSCRGYTSQSEMWVAAMRLLARIKAGKRVTILHLGDHDPSGKDMTRDILDRLRLFISHHAPTKTHRLDVNRIALNMSQVREYNPPPNPAKMSDARAAGYVEEFGDESWELDALPPDVLSTLIREHVEKLRDEEDWEEQVAAEAAHKATLTFAAENWDIVEKAHGEQDGTD